MGTMGIRPRLSAYPFMLRGAGVYIQQSPGVGSLPELEKVVRLLGIMPNYT